MSAATSITGDYLHQIRTKFFPDDPKGFGQQRQFILRAITYPAAYLEKRGTALPERRIRQILDEIIKGILHHGNTGKIGYFCAYFLKTVQEHMAHHGDAYYEEAKSFRLALDTFTENLTAKQAKRLKEAQEDTTDRLADIHRALATQTRRKPKKTDNQLSLL